MQTKQKKKLKREEGTRTIYRGKLKFSRKATALMCSAYKQTLVKKVGKF